jgi:hypothetical protein
LQDGLRCCVVDGNSSLHDAQQRLQAISSQHRQARSRAHPCELRKRSQPPRRGVWWCWPKQRCNHASLNEGVARARVLRCIFLSGGQRYDLQRGILPRRPIRASERLHQRCGARN